MLKTRYGKYYTMQENIPPYKPTTREAAFKMAYDAIKAKYEEEYKNKKND